MNRIEKRNRIGICSVTLVLMIIFPFLQTGIGLFVAIVEVMLLVIFGFAVGPLFGEQLGKSTGGLFLGSGRHEKTPLLSEAESAMKRCDYIRALELYRSVQDDFPAYMPIYQPLFELLAHRLPDREQMRHVYRIGWNAMAGDQRHRLEHLFQQFNH